MAGGYGSQPEGMGWIIERFARIESMLSAMNGANPAESIVITGLDGITTYDATAGLRLQLARAFLRFTQEGADAGGALSFADRTMLNTWGHPDTTVGETSLQMWGKSAIDPGYILLRTNGDIWIEGSDIDSGDAAGSVNLRATTVTIDGSTLGLYSLPTTSAGANLHLGTVGGVWTVAWVTSSARYKQDIADATIDPDAVLSWRPRTWRDKAEVEAVGDEATEHIGFIAEEIHDATPEFVVTDDEGRPDSLKYDRMVAGLVAVAQKQAEQIADLTQRLEALETAT